MNLVEINKILREKSPKEIVLWALSQAQRPVITTNFRPYEAAILHLCSVVKNDIPVIWCDTGYNTMATGMLSVLSIGCLLRFPYTFLNKR